MSRPAPSTACRKRRRRLTPPSTSCRSPASPRGWSHLSADVPAAIHCTVLLVDDQAIVGEAVRRMLAGEADVTFQYCADSAAALATARAAQPTVILQDLVMPGASGLDLLSAYRSDPATAGV